MQMYQRFKEIVADISDKIPNASKVIGALGMSAYLAAAAPDLSAENKLKCDLPAVLGIILLYDQVSGHSLAERTIRNERSEAELGLIASGVTGILSLHYLCEESEEEVGITSGDIGFAVVPIGYEGFKIVASWPF